MQLHVSVSRSPTRNPAASPVMLSATEPNKVRPSKVEGAYPSAAES